VIKVRPFNSFGYTVVIIGLEYNDLKIFNIGVLSPKNKS